MRKLLFYFAAALLSVSTLNAQVVQVSPLFPSRTGNITITFDASQGNKALMGVDSVYAHTGLITSRSTSTSDWKNIQDLDFNTPNPHVLMTNIGNNKFTFSFNINIFYGAFVTDTIRKLAFVFRNGNGSLAGKNADGSDILVSVYDDSLHVGFIQPADPAISLPIDTTLNILTASNRTGDLSLTLNGDLLNTASGTSLTYNNFHFLNYGAYNFTVTCNTPTDTVSSTFTALVNPPLKTQNLPNGAIEGINYIDDSTVILALLAPFKKNIYVIGDFNNWQIDTNYYMNRANDGQTWWLKVQHLIPGKEYIFQYLVDGSIRTGDPYSDKISDPNTDENIPVKVYPNLIAYPFGKTTGIASVLQTAQQPYAWKATNYKRPAKKNLMIYELLVRDFVTSGAWPQLIDSLHYLVSLGINAIELMPVMNFEGNSSWGYNPNYFCAPEKSYGTREMLKQLIDTCHSFGIAVILDIPFNDAFGTNPMVMMYWDTVSKVPAANNPWFNVLATHPFSVGYDFNHESIYTRNFVKRVCRTWIRDYHIDGYRFDLTKGYTQKYSGTDAGLWGQYDASRVKNLEGMVDSIWAYDPSSLLVFEELADNSEETELSNHGIMLWGNMNSSYTQATMGYPTNWDFSWASYKARGWANPNLVTYMESHDEERVMYQNEKFGNSVTGYNITAIDTACRRMEMAGVLFYTIPGPKMIWQFGELGYDIALNNGCRICNKPILWSYATKASRKHLYNVWAALIHLRNTYPAFQGTNFSTDLGGSVKTVHLPDGAVNFIGVGNFDVTTQTFSPGFMHTGWWYDYFSGDSMKITDNTQSFTYRPGEYHLYTDTYLQTPVFSTGIDVITGTETAKELLLYPNPTTGKFDMLFDIAEGGKAELEVYDLNGKLVYTQHQAVSAGINNITADLNAANRLVPGIYFYRLNAGQSVFNGKISIVNE